MLYLTTSGILAEELYPRLQSPTVSVTVDGQDERVWSFSMEDHSCEGDVSLSGVSEGSDLPVCIWVERSN